MSIVAKRSPISATAELVLGLKLVSLKSRRSRQTALSVYRRVLGEAHNVQVAGRSDQVGESG